MTQSIAEEQKIEQRDGVILARGSLSIRELDKVLKMAPKGAVIHPNGARMLGVDWLIGTPDAIERVLAPMKNGEMPVANPATETGLSNAARRWLDLGERGESSNALFAVMHNYPEAKGSRDNDGYWPHPVDPSDLRRCVKMLRETEVEQYVDRAAERISALSPEWAGLMQCWSELVATLDAEMSLPRQPDGSLPAPKTYKMMKLAIKDQ